MGVAKKKKERKKCSRSVHAEVVSLGVAAHEDSQLGGIFILLLKKLSMKALHEKSTQEKHDRIVLKIRSDHTWDSRSVCQGFLLSPMSPTGSHPLARPALRHQTVADKDTAVRVKLAQNE